MATTYEELEARVAALERLAQELKLEKLAKVLAGSGSKKSAKSTRRVREYTEEERKAIRARLLAGQEAARKRREAEAKAIKKARAGNSEKAKATEAEKPK
jgi:phage-related minor tail protein